VPGQETKKSLGQHWLQDDSILEAIVETGEVNDTDVVLEIGPGLGTLTEKLARTGARIKALEFDKDLINKLQKKFTNNQNVEILEGDIRTFDYRSLPANYKVIANIPYYLTSFLIRGLSETSNPPSFVVLLVQKEVAERICAGVGQMGILSVTAQFYFDCSLGIEVPAEYFTPPPKVDSQVVIMKHRSKKLFDVDEDKFFRLVKAGFSEKRKTLINSLSSGLGKDKDEIKDVLKTLKIKETIRAQELSLNDWHKIYLKLIDHLHA